MEKEISRSFINELNKSKLSPRDIGKIFASLLNSKLSYLSRFTKVKEYLDVQGSLDFDKGPKIDDAKAIECYIASVILKATEKGNPDILNILIRSEDKSDSDLYKLMNEAVK